jgi:hypothetical protein
MRAAATASAFAASRLQNHTPGLFSAVTYVRTFSSGNADSHGNGGVPRKRTPVMENGTIPIHAVPSKLSIAKPEGISGRSISVFTGQCANSRSCQDCAMIHGPPGKGHGRCAVSFNIFNIALAVRNSTFSSASIYPSSAAPNRILDTHD